MGQAKAALETLIQAIGLEGVHARSVDVRFIAYAVTRAHKLGELAQIKESAIAPYIMDVFAMQLRNAEYKFEEKEEENK